MILCLNNRIIPDIAKTRQRVGLRLPHAHPILQGSAPFFGQTWNVAYLSPIALPWIPIRTTDPSPGVGRLNSVPSARRLNRKKNGG